ncbi:LLM class flavin-dependent oxidoreductase [Actinoallomurus sp. CA-142502]|uniref:LLM class flavin-dependent oxidoreductase n=1 Tax=Actinoallomurus sp. CA-142502 TaxID=3239885 RepID=UPI003D8BD1B4
MDIGVGLPATLPGVPARELLTWATTAERLGFARLGVLDRLVYSSHEPLVALAGAAAVTERIGLATTILVAACRTDVALLAKQLAAVHELSAGRLVVGVAAGGREDDFAMAGASFRDRGRRLDENLARIRRVWADERLVPPLLVGPPPIVVGGHSPAAMRRAARHGDGWIMGGGSAHAYPELVARMRDAWTSAGRPGAPRMMAIAYTALGPGARDRAEQYLRDYYAGTGPYRDRVVRGLLTDEKAVDAMVRDHAAAGCDELIFFPCVPDLGQLELLAEVTG